MIDLGVRYKAVVHYEHFLPSLRKVAKLYSVSKSSLQRWVSNKCGPKQKAAKRRKAQLCKVVADCVNACLASNPMQTMSALQMEVAKRCGLRRSVRTVGRWVHRLGYRFKKAYTFVPPVPDAPRVQDFCSSIQGKDPDQIVWIDEAGFYVGDHATRGYSPVGKRLRVAASRTLRRIKLTLLMAMTKTGVVHFEILDSNCNKLSFARFVHGLAGKVSGNATLVMDNVQFHKSKEACDAYRSIGCSVLYTPPYSPRLNAIEYAFSLMKRMYRRECSDIQASCNNLTRSDYEDLLHDVILFPHDLAPCVARSLDTARAGDVEGKGRVQTHD